MQIQKLPTLAAQNAAPAIPAARKVSACAIMAERLGIDATKLANVVKKTCIKGSCTDEQFAAFVVVANNYGLNPLTKEVHAFADKGGIVPIVGIDGWTHIVNDRKDYDGCEFEFSGDLEAKEPLARTLACTCRIFKKGCAHPIAVTEYYAECYRPTGPWNGMPHRMLRHKAFMQAARVAFSLGGIYDPDEADDIRAAEAAAPAVAEPAPAIVDVTPETPAPAPAQEPETVEAHIEPPPAAAAEGNDLF